MKKVLSILTVLCITLSLIACGNTHTDSPDALVDKGTEISSPAEKPEEVTVAEQVIFDQEDVKITVTGLDVTGSFWGPELKLLIENNRKENITVQANHVAVNGIMVETSLSSDIAAEKKANASLSIFSSDIELAAIEAIKDIELTLNIFNSDSWNDIVTSDLIHISTSATDYVQSYDDSGSLAYDDNGVKIVVKKIDSEDSFWGADVLVYIENNRNEDITLQADNVSINGFMVSPAFSSDILAGKKTFDTITFFESDLQDNNITDITEIELSFYGFNMASWDDIFRSDTITIKLQ